MHFYSSNDRDKDNGKNNSIYCRYCSTSPKVEPPGFCESMRATFRFWKFSRFIWSLIWQLGLIWTGLMMMALMKSTPLCTGLMISCRRMISDPRPLQSLFAGNAVFIFILDFILFFVQTWYRRYLLINHLFLLYGLSYQISLAPIVGKTRGRRRHVCAIFQACCAIFLPVDTQ